METPNNDEKGKEHCIAKGESAASHHYWRETDKKVLTNIKVNRDVEAMLPDLDKIKSSEQGEVPLAPTLTTRARTALVLPKLGSASLISLGQLCDDGCRVVLRKKYLDVVKNGKVILKGTRNRQDKLWDIPIPQALNNSHPQTMKESVILTYMFQENNILNA